tara:strand:+ start:361 stop:939 length:579 start_codon:yes stop_codon:yes gene_type:complete
MAYNREGYAPWSLTREAGVQSATVDGTIEVPQYIQPVLDTGFVDEKGDWKGTKSSDEQFIQFQKDEAIANGGEILTKTINMTGFQDMQIAINPSNGGNFAIQAIMGDNGGTEKYANLAPLNSAAPLKGTIDTVVGNNAMDTIFSDAAESLTADVWNIFYIGSRLRGQKLLGFKITNNSGGNSDIQTAFLRLV